MDRQTAWAALAADGEGGLILHTTDGGSTWDIQSLPEPIPDGMKGIKGMSREEAWAVGLKGPVLHTLDGGRTWQIVPTDGVTLRQVNRMDVLGQDIWIADYGNGDKGMVHSADSGQSWRQEQLPSVYPGHGPMTASIVSPQVVWTTVNFQGDIYRTQDGGTTWNLDAPRISGPNDIDDLSAVSDHEVWAVQNLSGGDEGHVMRVTIVGSQAVHKDWSFPQYVYEGISSFDGSTAWVVGFKAIGADPSLPDGSILHTSDGETWTSQPLPVSDVALWKVSFVGARR
ncbi:MAG: WD40/YVTN/BNR-like repeat-containing protein [Candidatus Binatia bacterium]